MADWELFDSWTYSTDVAQVDFTGLAGYTNFEIVARGITKSVSTVIGLRLSIDNGSSFMSGASDYAFLASSGVESTNDAVTIHETNATAARSAVVYAPAINVNGAPKVVLSRIRNVGANTWFFLGSTSPVTAFRVFPYAGGNFTGGSLYAYAAS